MVKTKVVGIDIITVVDIRSSGTVVSENFVKRFNIDPDDKFDFCVTSTTNTF